MSDHRIFPLAIGFASIAAGSIACEHNADRFGQSWLYDAPQSTDSSLTYIDHTHHEVLFATPDADRLTLTRRSLGSADEEATLWSRVTRNGASLLVLTGPVNAKKEHVSEKLYRFSADGTSDPVVTELSAPFNSVALSPDYQHAVLYFSGAVPGEVLHNSNLVAIVDLTSATVAHEMTLQGFGGQLTSVHFPGQVADGVPNPVLVGDHQRDIVAFLAEGEIILADMASPGANQPAVSLADTSGVNPVATLLRPGNAMYPAPTLFVRFKGGSDVSMLSLRAKDDAEDAFTFTQSLLGVGRGTSDFVFYDDAETPMLVAANGRENGLIFTDIRTQQTFTIGLGSGVGSLFLRKNESASGSVDQAVVWSQGGTTVYTLDLDDIENVVGRLPTEYRVNGGIRDLVVLDNNRVLVGAPDRLVIIDFARDQITPFAIQSDYSSFESGLYDDRLILGSPGQSWISTVNLNTLAPESMLLDDNVDSFHFLPASGMVVATHNDDAGKLTVTPAGELSRTKSYVHWGFLLEGLLDRS
ncbi:MAG: hypothetical protein V3V08_09905 [Nannocystaceae bacterium]